MEKDAFSFAVLITAAGNSSRMNGKTKKEYQLFQGKPVLFHAIDAFLRSEICRWFVITFPPGTRKEMEKILAAHPVYHDITLVEGGNTRQESVRKGLESLKEKAPSGILIHDGARPWIKPELIREVAKLVREYGAAAPAVPVVNTPKRIGPEGRIEEHCSRDEVMGIQTPQGFRYTEILEAHKKAADDGCRYVDDTEIYHRYMGPVMTCTGDPENRKITYSHDLEGLQ